MFGFSANVFRSVFEESRDPFKDGPEQILGSKTAHSNVTLGKVEDVDMELNRVAVRILRAGGSGDAIWMPIETDYIGSVPGTGSVKGFSIGDLVRVSFTDGVSDGLINQGTVVGRFYTQKDRPAPKHPMLSQNKDQVASMTMYPGKNGEGNTDLTTNSSDQFVVKTGNHKEENMGAKTIMQGGELETYTERETAKIANAFDVANSKIKV